MLYKSKFINTYTHNYHDFLAFHARQLYNSINRHKEIKIKKIQLKDSNELTMQRVLLKNIKINTNIFCNIQNRKLYIKSINKVLQKLKSSGYISSIKIFNINTQDSKYITLNLKVNPIVKKITILNYEKLKVPSHFLKYVFRKHIGMPKNYRLINESLKLIYIWYKSRGFVWVNIKLIEKDISDAQNIFLKIMEGIVKDVQLTCYTNNLYNPELVKILDSLIKKELNIYPGSVLNIKKIEEGIRSLTNLNIIEDCSYSIKRDKADLIVIINYNISKNHITYFYNYNSILKNYSTYRIIYNLLNKYVSNLKLFSKYILYIRKFHIYSSIIQINQYLGFTYKSFYSKNNINNIAVNLAVLQDYPQLKIDFSYPYIYKQKKILGYLIIKIFNKIIKPYLCYPFLLIELNGMNNIQRSNLSTYLYHSICLLKHSLLKNLYILERIWTISNKYKKINISMKDYQISQSIIKNSLIQPKIFNIIKLFKYIKYKLIYLQISIKYNNLNFWDHLKAGKLVTIYSTLCTYILRNYNKNCNRLIYLGQNIGVKYIQVFNLPKIFTYIYHHTLMIFSELNFLINSRLYWPTLDQSYNIKKYVSFKRKYNKNFPLYFFYLCNIEYHISKLKHLSIYFFWNYTTYSYNQKKHKPYTENTKNIYICEMSLGSGIKFYIPIKKLPHIYLEYSIDNKGKHFLVLSTDSKYN